MKTYSGHKFLLAMIVMGGIIAFVSGAGDSSVAYLTGVGLAIIVIAVFYGLAIGVASDINAMKCWMEKWMMKEGVIEEEKPEDEKQDPDLDL